MMRPQDFRFPYEDWRTGKARPEPIIQDDPRWLRNLILAANIAVLLAFILLAVGVTAYATRPPASTSQPGSPSDDRGVKGGKHSL